MILPCRGFSGKGDIHSKPEQVLVQFRTNPANPLEMGFLFPMGSGIKS